MAQKSKESKSKVNIHYLKILNLWSCPFKKVSVNCNLIFTACLWSCVCAYTEQQKVRLLHVHTSSRGIECILFCLLLSSFIPQTSVLFVVFSTMYLHFFVGGFALKVFPEHGTEILSSVPKHRRLSYTLWKKYLDKLCSGMSYSAVWPLAHC